MNHTEYHNYCIEESKKRGYNFQKKDLHGFLLDGQLSLELTKELTSELKIQEENFRGFVSGMSKILDITAGGNLEALMEKTSNEIMPKLYDVFGCFVKIQEIKILRHMQLGEEDAKRKEGAFIWHSDQHPTELVNIIVYLDEITNEGCGPFQYIEDSAGNAVYANVNGQYIGDAEASKFGNTKSVFGKSGHFFAFDNNFIHRAYPATSQKRDVIIFQVRPTSKKSEKFIDWNYMNMKFDQQLANWEFYE